MQHEFSRVLTACRLRAFRYVAFAPLHFEAVAEADLDQAPAAPATAVAEPCARVESPAAPLLATPLAAPLEAPLEARLLDQAPLPSPGIAVATEMAMTSEAWSPLASASGAARPIFPAQNLVRTSLGSSQPGRPSTRRFALLAEVAAAVAAPPPRAPAPRMPGH
jgi:hypothetical protein